MSNYRDDTQETAVASDGTWMGLRSIAESTAKATAVALFTLGVIHTDQAAAGDEVFDSGLGVIAELAFIGDELIDHRQSAALLSDSAKVSDQYTHRLVVIHTDAAAAGDALIELSGSVITDQARITDEVLGHRAGQSTVTDQARIADYSYQAATDLVEDTAVASGQASGTLQALDVVADAAAVLDGVDDTSTTATVAVTETASVSDGVTDSLSAADVVSEWLLIGDHVLGEGSEAGQAWTACVDGWAMSRYAPYTFTRLVVIDGIMYGESDAGVFALSGGSEQIEAKVVTGRIDMSGGPLTRPVAAYLEYELEGEADMSVTTTQTGMPATYTYPLPNEVAEHLANGRIQFGRGLRGRHFSFELRMSGQRGYINDLSVMAQQVRRRV